MKTEALAATVLRGGRTGLRQNPDGRFRRASSLLIAVSAGFALFVSAAPAARAQRTIIVQNNCNQTIWPGIYEQGIDGNPPPNPQPMNGGWALSSGQSTTLTLPTGFSGRIWARKDCTFNASGQGECETGDCGGVLQCNGATGAAGTSLAEFTLYQPNDLTQFPQDNYDVSYADGYDFPISITPSNPSFEAPTVNYDMLPTCPLGQQVKNAQGIVVECLSACIRYGNDPTVPASVQEMYCCNPPYNNAALCNPSNYPNPPGNLNAPMKAAAPNSYSFSDDDNTSEWHYNSDPSVTYTVTFCPTSYYGSVVQTSGTGSYNGPTSTSGSWNSCSTNTSTVPSAPVGLAATAGNGSVALTWGASSGATSYNVYRGAISGGEGSTSYATAISGTTYTDTGVTNGTTYYYTVAAVNSAGTSPQSGEVSATPTAGGTSTGGGTTGGGTTGGTSGGGTTGGGSTTTATMIDCGGAASGSWSADAGFSGGSAISVTNAINLSGAPYPAPTQAVMQTERDGNVTYTVTGLTPNSTHTVDLYFSENNFNAAGQRQFDVAINGSTVLTNFDVFANTGAEYKAIEQSFSTTASSSGQIAITLTTVKYNAEINGIAIQ